MTGRGRSTLDDLTATATADRRRVLQAAGLTAQELQRAQDVLRRLLEGLGDVG